MTDPLSEYRKDGTGVQPSARAVAFERWFAHTFPNPSSIFDTPGAYEAVEKAFDAGWNARRNYEDANPRPAEKWCVNGQPFG